MKYKNLFFKPFYLGEQHNWRNVDNVVQILCYDTKERRDLGEEGRKEYYDSGMFSDTVFLRSRRSLKLRAVYDPETKLWMPFILEYDNLLREEWIEGFATAEKCLEFLKSKIYFVE